MQAQNCPYPRFFPIDGVVESHRVAVKRRLFELHSFLLRIVVYYVPRVYHPEFLKLAEFSTALSMIENDMRASMSLLRDMRSIKKKKRKKKDAPHTTTSL